MAHIVGWIDGIFRGRVRGWVLDSTAPLRRVHVELIAPTEGRVAVACADHYRADVYKGGLSDGYCGFSIDAARVMAGASYRVFSIRPQVELTAASSPLGKQVRLERNGVMLHLDKPVRPPCLTGWAKCLKDPEVRRDLTLRWRGRALCRQKATLYRSASVAGGSDGFHGFALPLPELLEDLIVEDVLTGTEFSIPRT